jgi:hypothetical protein
MHDWFSKFNQFGLMGDRFYDELVRDMFHTGETAEMDGYSGSFQRFVGEQILRPLVGDENLGTLEYYLQIGAVTVAVVGVGAAFLVLGPGAFFLTAGVGFLGGFAFDAAAQYDSTDGWADFDWQRATTAGVIGAVTSVIIAAGGGPVLAGIIAKIPGACTIVTWSLRGLALNGVYTGAQEIYRGNYATGTLTIITSVFAVYGAFKTSFCFVAGTQVVLDSESQWPLTITLVGLGLLGQQAILRRKRRGEEDDQSAIDACFDDGHSDEAPPVPDAVETNARSQTHSAEEFDALCDRFFSSEAPDSGEFWSSIDDSARALAPARPVKDRSPNMRNPHQFVPHTALSAATAPCNRSPGPSSGLATRPGGRIA